MEKPNIFTGYDFSRALDKSVYDYLKEQDILLYNATSGILKMEIERIHAVSLVEGCSIIYIVSVVCPKLGKYRKRILKITENEHSHFPVTIYCEIDEKTNENVSETGFLDMIKSILSRFEVKNVIENLYKQSISVI